MSDESRSSDRNKCVYKVYSKETNDKEPVGIMLDISPTGANLLVDVFKLANNNAFSITIQPPGSYASNHNFLNLNVQKVWEEGTRSPYHKKIGCQFIDLTDRQKEQVNRLVELLKNNPPAQNVRSSNE